MPRRARILLKTLVWVLCLLPLVSLVYRAISDDLTPNPISFLTNQLGDWTLRLLLISLGLTPLRILTGQAWPLLFRRLLGLFAFAYALLHFGVWIVLDHFFDWPQMLGDILKRRYITVGMAALALLIPLAVTSTGGMLRRLGGRRWRLLHKLVYAAAICAVVHYLWLAKVGVQTPRYYAAILAVLLGIRIVDAARRAARKRLAPARAKPACSPSAVTLPAQASEEDPRVSRVARPKLS